MSEKIIWKKAKILPRLYEKFCKALAGEGPCPQIVKFKAGYGFINEDADIPELLDIPSDTEDIPGIIYEGSPEKSSSGGTALFKCVIPEGAVSSPEKITVIGLYDQFDDLVAAVVFLPEWITPEKNYENLVHITFPVEGEDAE